MSGGGEVCTKNECACAEFISIDESPDVCGSCNHNILYHTKRADLGGLSEINMGVDLDTQDYKKDQAKLFKGLTERYPKEKILYRIVDIFKLNRIDIEMVLVFTIPPGKTTITLPIIEEGGPDEFGYYVEWGNDSSGELIYTYNNKSYEYLVDDEAREYTVKIFGLGITGFGCMDSEGEEHRLYENYSKYLTSVISFGKLGHKFTNLSYAFSKCHSLTNVPLYLPANITIVDGMFKQCVKLIDNRLEEWRVDNIVSSMGMFQMCSTFNGNLSRWNLKNLTSANFMFLNCRDFEGADLNNWGLNNLNHAIAMFRNCVKFEGQSLDRWNLNNLMLSNSMFNGCTSFVCNDVSNWGLSNLIDADYMFNGCASFVGTGSNNWNLNKLTNAGHMFNNCVKFVFDDVSNWGLTSLVEGDYMFNNCTNFIGTGSNNWNLNNLTKADGMFAGCSNFTYNSDKYLDLRKWGLRSLQTADQMFLDCNKFNGNLSRCKIPVLLTHDKNMFLHCNLLAEYRPFLTD